MMRGNTYLEKRKSIPALTNVVGKLKLEKKVIVATGGVFDILHIGHVRLLHKAKNLGDVLLVFINSDQSTKKLKGENRPVQNEKDRAEILCALMMVDYVSIFAEPTPETILRIIHPDIWVKGDQYTRNTIPETDIVEHSGGRVVFVPMVEGYSTTRILHSL